VKREDAWRCTRGASRVQHFPAACTAALRDVPRCSFQSFPISSTCYHSDVSSAFVIIEKFSVKQKNPTYPKCSSNAPDACWKMERLQLRLLFSPKGYHSKGMFTRSLASIEKRSPRSLSSKAWWDGAHLRWVRLQPHVDPSAPVRKDSLRTTIPDFRKFDLNMLLMLTGGIVLSIGTFLETWCQRILVWMILVGRLGVVSKSHWRDCQECCQKSASRAHLSDELGLVDRPLGSLVGDSC